jgi:Bifunctional DNA primase/polymerase, N-terminal
MNDSTQQASNAATLKSAAIRYAQAGRAVFPLKPGTKVPLTDHGLSDATTDLKTIEAWWNTWPTANIALRPNEGEYVLDLDTRDDGYATMADRSIQLGALSDEHPVAESPMWWDAKKQVFHGGQHIWISYDGERLKSKFGPGVDIRSHRNYLVAPPSIIDGKQYRWRNPLFGSPPRSDAWTAAARRPEPKPKPVQQKLKQYKQYGYGESVIEKFNSDNTWADVLTPHGWTNPHRNVWLHPNATSSCSATVSDDDRLYVYSTNTAFDVTSEQDPHGYDRFDAYTLLEHGGDTKAAIRALQPIAPWPTGINAEVPRQRKDCNDNMVQLSTETNDSDPSRFFAKDGLQVKDLADAIMREVTCGYGSHDGRLYIYENGLWMPDDGRIHTAIVRDARQPIPKDALCQRARRHPIFADDPPHHVRPGTGLYQRA